MVVDLPSLLSNFFFLVFFFFFLTTWLLELVLSPSEVEEEDVETGEEGEGSTFESTWCCSGGEVDGGTVVETTAVGNN